MKDGRLISCSGDFTINIYEKDTFKLQISIKEHSSHVTSINQLNNGKIISCSLDYTMKIIKLKDKLNDGKKYELEQSLSGHTCHVMNVIEIIDNELISISRDSNMKIWKLKNNEFKCIKTINFQKSYSDCNILKINENEFVTSSETDECLTFWNSNDYSNFCSINGIESNCSTMRTLCLINNKILCVGGSNSKGFYLINLSNHHLIRNIHGPEIIYSIYKCFDGLFLCSIKNNNGNLAIAKYRYENKEMKKIFEKENIHEQGKIVYTCFELNNRLVVTGGEDKLIKLGINE